MLTHYGNTVTLMDTLTTRCQRLTGGTMTLFQITFVSIPIKSSFTAWREKAVVKVYTIDFSVGTGDPTCTSPDWLKWHILCKHVFDIFRLVEGWGWNALPDMYKTSAYLSVDSTALSKQHSLSHSLSSEGVTELGSSRNDDVKSPLRDILPTEKVRYF